MKRTSTAKILFLTFTVVLLGALLFFYFVKADTAVSYNKNSNIATIANAAQSYASTTPTVPLVLKASHVPTPAVVKGIYMTSWVAGVPKLRKPLVDLIDKSDLNALVIDIKDYSGKIVFSVQDPELKKFKSEEIRIKDLREFIETLHAKNIYVMGRIAVFQDANFVKLRPDLAVKNLAGTATWKDRKGISWIDAGAKDYWKYIALIGDEAYKAGFDELNFDYIRFPSDGNMKDISFPQSNGMTKADTLVHFFSFLHDHFAGSDVVTNIATSSIPVMQNNGLSTSTLISPISSKYSKTERPVISADLFGMVTSVKDDMGIGQILENALPYFDYICPMVYPSHYPTTFNGYAVPEAHPYEVVKFAMAEGVKREIALFSPVKPKIASSTLAASTTPAVAPNPAFHSKLRPWLQDFGLKVTYGVPQVQAQIKASHDVGLDSYLMWSASNHYTNGAY